MTSKASALCSIIALIACANFLCVVATADTSSSSSTADWSSSTLPDSSSSGPGPEDGFLDKVSKFTLFGLTSTATLILVSCVGFVFLTSLWCFFCCCGCCKACVKKMLCAGLRRMCVRCFFRGCINCCGPDMLQEVYSSTMQDVEKGIKSVKDGVKDGMQGTYNMAAQATSMAGDAASAGAGLVRKHTLSAIQTITVKGGANSD